MLVGVLRYILCHVSRVLHYEVNIQDFNAGTYSPSREFGVEHSEQKVYSCNLKQNFYHIPVYDNIDNNIY